MNKQLQPGSKAPAFHTTAVGGIYGDWQAVKLADFRSQNVVLYFYPKDDTPGCSAQACGLRDAWGEFAGKAAVFGVSIDSAQSHAKFIAKHALPFPLLVDEDKEIVAAYGVWVVKSMYGKTYMGTERTTFVIGGDGKIKAIFRTVKPDQPAALVLVEL